jgi:hypothetical protein
MARIGISITKSVAFRNATQEFSNVYYYQNSGALPDETSANALIDELVTFEKTIHGSSVTFVRGRCWSQVGSPSSNNMIAQKNLSGTGSLTPNATVDRERAFLFKIRAGVDSRGNPVWLRKWFHACAVFPGMSLDTTILANSTGFSQGQRDGGTSAMSTISAIGGGTEEWKLVSKAGRAIDSGATWVAHPFLEHHQLGDQWRAQ